VIEDSVDQHHDRRRVAHREDTVDVIDPSPPAGCGRISTARRRTCFWNHAPT
jgi:hypothetical protein